MQAVRRRIEREGTVDPNARDLVLRGWARLDRGDANRAEIQLLFERALEIDPQSASADARASGRSRGAARGRSNGAAALESRAEWTGMLTKAAYRR